MGKLNLDRDFSRFFNRKDFPHEVAVWFRDKRFVTCSGMVLAQQSAVMEDIICSNNGVLLLKNMDEYSLTEIKECFRLLYGADIAFSWENVGFILLFSSLYAIKDLFSYAFDWIVQRITTQSLFKLFELSSKLRQEHKLMLIPILEDYLANNSSDVAIEVRKLIKDGKIISTDFLCALLKHSLLNCGDIVISWVAADPSKVSFILENIESLDILQHYPHADDFSQLISCLSANADSLQTMEKLINLQKNYFSKLSRYVPAKESTSYPVDSEPTCNAIHQYKLVDGVLHLSSKTMPDFTSMVSVSNIPVYAQKEDLERVLSKVGTIIDMSLININCFSQLAFVSYKTVYSAKKALSQNIFVYRNKLTVKSFVKPTNLRSSAEKRLFVKKVPIDASKRDVKRCFSHFGAIKEIEIIRHQKCAFIEAFDFKTVAMLIHLSMNGVTFKISGYKVVIEEFKSGKK